MSPATPTGVLTYYLTDFWAENGDPRALAYPLMDSFGYNLAIVLAYYAFVLWLGPAIMRHRKPYSLKPLLIVYNLILSVTNFAFFCRIMIKSAAGTELLNVNYVQQKAKHFNSTDATLAYLYLLSKYIDMLDTVFFTLRKKSSQITGLHVYHHSSVPFLGWIHFRLKLASHTTIAFALLNTPIHTLMYAYYGLAAMGPHMQPYLWWKRYITQIQIGQFVLLFAYGVYFCTFQTGYSGWYTVDILFQTSLYFILFTRFYLKAYVRSRSDAKANVAAAMAASIKNDDTKKLN